MNNGDKSAFVDGSANGDIGSSGLTKREYIAIKLYPTAVKIIGALTITSNNTGGCSSTNKTIETLYAEKTIELTDILLKQLEQTQRKS